MSRLERWSRLKRNAQSEQREPATPLTGPVDSEAPEDEAEQAYGAADQPATQPSSPDDLDDEPTRAPEPGSLDHTLPDPDTLEAGSDFSAFMVPGVSGSLRRRALKRLWATGNYNVRDGLDDYDADYRQQLKPMAEGLAENLRRWTHKIEEAADKQLDEAQPESQQDLAASEQSTESEHDSATEQSAASKENASGSCTVGSNTVKSASLDDQSDYFSNAEKKP